MSSEEPELDGYTKSSDLTGKTCDAMRAAPRGALYVWENEDFQYPRALAVKIKRSDLSIVSPKMFDGGGYRLRGQAVPVILDHATELDDEQQSVLNAWRILSEGKKR